MATSEQGMSNVGRWEPLYAPVSNPTPYGDVRSYQVGAAFLSDCTLVEDWGCGLGWMRRYVHGDDRYRGIDGSATRFADAVVDLCHYRSDVDGVFMRHVLEHNVQWRLVLANALASMRRRGVIVLFTPLTDQETQLAWHAEIGVPDLSLPRQEFEAALSEYSWTAQTKQSDTQYGEETIVLISAPGVEHDNAVEGAWESW